MTKDISQTLKENGVDKISFYFTTSEIVNNAFTTCVFLNSVQKRIEARGVAICSLLDVFSKNTGKNKAFGRAMRALVRRENKWKISGSSRDYEVVQRSIKIKTPEDEDYFHSVIIPELTEIYPELKVSTIKTSGYKKYLFDIPLSYPVRMANSLYKYKSQYRPTLVGEKEKELLESLY